MTSTLAPARLDRRVELQQWDGSAWIVANTVWAEKAEKGALTNVEWARATDADARLVDSVNLPDARAVYRIRYLSGVTPAWRVRDGSDTWNVLAVGEGEGRKEWMLLTVTPFADYDADHAAVLADLLEYGAAVTFSKVSQTHNPLTDELTSSTVTVAGPAMEVPPDTTLYESLSLVVSESPTLLFVPTTAGETPSLGSTVTWSGTTYSVKRVDPVAPAGTAIRARVVLV